MADHPSNNYASTRRRPSVPTIAGVLLLHLLLFYALLRAFTPDTVRTVERAVVAAFTVAPSPSPSPTATVQQPVPEGAAGKAGKKAVPRPVSAPSPKVVRSPAAPMPRVASSGTKTSSGTRDTGDGTGGASSGAGTGSGNGGMGQGGAAVTRPVKIAGDINAAADFPVPPGGRQSRFGTSVTVYMTVGVDGRAHNCRIVRPSPDPQADAIVCQLAEQRFRFRPAINAQGEPVPATYGWRQEWFAR
ncbi:MAG: energy transducer TonB [Sphingomonadaceae bacterium]